MQEYYDRDFSRSAIKLLPGEFHVTADDHLIVTVLGSCIAVCLRDEEAAIVGMNHFLLPLAKVDIPPQKVASYGVNAMELMINGMMKLGASRHRLTAKVFGGANVSIHIQQSRIGSLNSAFIVDYLKTENIPIVAKDILGVQARRVCYLSTTGVVNVKRISIDNSFSILSREKSLLEKVSANAKEGDVDLF